jgi:hypothetical protein
MQFVSRLPIDRLRLRHGVNWVVSFDLVEAGQPARSGFHRWLRHRDNHRAFSFVVQIQEQQEHCRRWPDRQFAIGRLLKTAEVPAWFR